MKQKQVKGEYMLDQGQPGLQIEFQDKLQSYTEKHCLENQKKKKVKYINID